MLLKICVTVATRKLIYHRVCVFNHDAISYPINNTTNLFGTMNNQQNDTKIDEDDPHSSISKGLVRDAPTPKKISHLQFGMLDQSEMQRLAEFQVTSRELFSMPSRTPAAGGVLDPRLGVSDKVSTCTTCRRKLADCTGHYGYIRYVHHRKIYL